MFDRPCGGGYTPPPPPQPKPKPEPGPAPWPQPPFPPCQSWPDPDCPCQNWICPSCGWCESRPWVSCPPAPPPQPVCCSPCLYLTAGYLLCCLCRR